MTRRAFGQRLPRCADRMPLGSALIVTLVLTVGCGDSTQSPSTQGVAGKTLLRSTDQPPPEDPPVARIADRVVEPATLYWGVGDEAIVIEPNNPSDLLSADASIHVDGLTTLTVVVDVEVQPSRMELWSYPPMRGGELPLIDDATPINCQVVAWCNYNWNDGYMELELASEAVAPGTIVVYLEWPTFRSVDVAAGRPLYSSSWVLNFVVSEG